ncbi:DUF721 domain-containing protein [Zafaria sp. Z1313]|uniref:DUF721 domain-containing protein n=1 Tax=Zafaria sp. Z1313 TaxID=3423202 RepID=UPI003D3026F8
MSAARDGWDRPRDDPDRDAPEPLLPPVRPGPAAGRGQAFEPDEVAELDAARAMVNRMREAAARRGEVRMDAARAQRAGERRAADRAARRAGPRGIEYDDGRDPQGIGTVFERMLRDRGWSSPVAVGSVLTEWDALVGGQVAAHCRPESFEGTTVVVRCDSTAWATQLRLLSNSLLKTFDEKLGPGVVTVIQVLGPSAPSWQKGRRRIAGRGPRDTYG